MQSSAIDRRSTLQAASASSATASRIVNVMLARSFLPGHSIGRSAGSRIGVVTGDDKTLALVERDGGRVVLIDMQLQPAGRNAARRLYQSRGDAAALCLRGDDNLVDIAARRLDRHQSRQPAVALGDQ